jgi:hypothetical protein
VSEAMERGLPTNVARRMVENVARARAEGADHDSPFGGTRNKRSVWTINTAPFPEAHFATFPEDLVTPCILAGARHGDTVLDPFSGAATVAVETRAKERLQAVRRTRGGAHQMGSRSPRMEGR